MISRSINNPNVSQACMIIRKRSSKVLRGDAFREKDIDRPDLSISRNVVSQIHDPRPWTYADISKIINFATWRIDGNEKQ